MVGILVRAQPSPARDGAGAHLFADGEPPRAGKGLVLEEARTRFGRRGARAGGSAEGEGVWGEGRGEMRGGRAPRLPHLALLNPAKGML